MILDIYHVYKDNFSCHIYKAIFDTICFVHVTNQYPRNIKIKGVTDGFTIVLKKLTENKRQSSKSNSKPAVIKAVSTRDTDCL